MNFERLKKDVFIYLKKNLDASIVYHTVDHTREILDNTVFLAGSEDIAGKNLVLLKTAALMHDLGYTESHIEHEKISCELAAKWLPEYGYEKADIEKINAMIMATRIPQSPENRLCEILCDADLFYLGGKDYFEKAGLLYTEMKNLNTLENESQWLQVQIDFLSFHNYFTESGKSTQSPGKRKNLNRLLAKQKSIENEQTL